MSEAEEVGGAIDRLDWKAIHEEIQRQVYELNEESGLMERTVHVGHENALRDEEESVEDFLLTLEAEADDNGYFLKSNRSGELYVGQFRIFQDCNSCGKVATCKHMVDLMTAKETKECDSWVDDELYADLREAIEDEFLSVVGDGVIDVSEAITDKMMDGLFGIAEDADIKPDEITTCEVHQAVQEFILWAVGDAMTHEVHRRMAKHSSKTPPATKEVATDTEKRDPRTAATLPTSTTGNTYEEIGGVRLRRVRTEVRLIAANI